MVLKATLLILFIFLTFGALLSPVKPICFAHEDELMDEGASVETEDEPEIAAKPEPGTPPPEDENAKTDMTTTEKQIGPAEDLKCSIFFLEYGGDELPAGKYIKSLIHLHSIAERDFHLINVEASLRYPADFSYYLQNFTDKTYPDVIVKAGRQATIFYAFHSSTHYSGRPFGLTVNVNYKTSDSDEAELFQDSVFNKTVNFYEVDEGFDGETFFMYVFFVAIAIMLILVAYSFLYRNKKSGRKTTVELGTVSQNGITNEWLPSHARAQNSPRKPVSSRKSPRASPGRNSKKDN